jgi:Flp pilus assembly protein TadG
MLHSPRTPNRSATIAPLVAVTMSGLLAVTAVAMEGGNILEQRRRVQGGADAAALSAAADLYANYAANSGDDSLTHTAATSATNNASDNGYANDDDGTRRAGTSNVSALLYPSNYTGGPNQGTQIPRGYVEVTVSLNVARYFSQIWGSNTIAVFSRSAARGQWLPSPHGVIALNPTASPGLASRGSPGVINVTGNAPIIVNSNATPAVAGNITASQIYAVGNSLVGGVPYTKLPAPYPDPLGYIPQPSATGTTNALGKGLPYNPPSIGTDVTSGQPIYGPGIYDTAPSPGGGKGKGGSGPGSGVRFQPDPANPQYAPVAVLLTGWGTLAQQTVRSDGIMLFATTEGSQFSGQSAVTLNPPSSGPYTGIAYFLDRSNTSPLIISGQGAVTINGAYYAAASPLSVRGIGSITINGQLIFDSGDTRGNGTLNINYTASQVGRTRQICLVE